MPRLPVGVVMTRAIRDYYEQTGYKVGFKPAGGIRSAKESLDWLILMKEELGNEWLNNHAFPHRRQRLAFRYRAATFVLCHRPLRGGTSQPDGVGREATGT